MQTNERYEGNPMLRLLECYVLKAIGELSTENEQSLKAMEPTLAKAYQTQGSWDTIISKAMDFPEKMPALIQQKWLQIQEVAQREKAPLEAQQFAEMFVDSNLV